MGDLLDKRIIQTRNWIDPNPTAIPAYDYEFVYPITVFDAVKRDMDDNSPNLTDELNAIYRLIGDKQDIIQPGTPGQIMTWSGILGQIGALEVTRGIGSDPAIRSHSKIPTERAVGDALDTRASLSALVTHTDDHSIHLTDIERNRWNSMAPLSSLQAHTANAVMHITNIERGRWNGKAESTDLDAHIYNTNNPHNTTAHQVGTYTRKEIDDTFAALRESFFNYLNISWDDRSNNANLVKYNPANWNPNFILAFKDALPDVSDATATYFALKPATDYTVNETQDCIIYIKRPGLAWQEVGTTVMNAGDMIIKFPDTTMYVWVQGRFSKVFSDSNSGGSDDGINGNVWRPTIDAAGQLTWVLSKETTVPAAVNIKGQDGYSPIKGIDYADGKDGQGVPVGGAHGDLLVKLSDNNFDTTWKTLNDLFKDMALSGSYLPQDIVIWDNIKGKPNKYTELGPNDDGYITQKAATNQFNVVNNRLTEVLGKIDGPTGIDSIKNDLYDHINDYNNPHRVTPAIIGAVSITTHNDHIQNFSNPHNVTKTQVGLGNVDNTSDSNKPISAATQGVLDLLKDRITVITDNVAAAKYITNVKWDNPTNNLLFTFKDNSTLGVTIPITDVFKGIHFDNDTKELVITLPDGTENRINITALIQTYYGSVGANVQVIVENDHIIKASIIPGSVGQMEISPSVHLRSDPTTTTQNVSDRSERIATTQFVSSQVINNLISYETDRALSANMGRMLQQTKADTSDVIKLINDLEGLDVIDTLDSTNPMAALSANMGRYLDLVKAPRVHTSPSGSTFGCATISLFGHTRASEEDPLMDGTVFRGTDNGRYARGDHRHPTDITRAPLNSPKLTGEPTTPTPPDFSNDERIVNTEWIRKNVPGVLWGSCETDTADNVKVATLKASYTDNPVFFLQIGSTVVIKFKHGDDSANITQLNVHDSGPASIHFESRPIVPHMIGTDRDHMFTFDGIHWQLLNPSSATEVYGGNATGPVNQMTEFVGFTIEGYGGTVNSEGEVNRAIFTIAYKDIKPEGSKVTISTGSDDWGARMGDNQLIPIINPVVLLSDRSHAIVQFTLTDSYPSNSPCAIVFKRPQACIKIESDGSPIAFIPVQSISGVPSSVNVGVPIKLTSISPYPANATNQRITWSIYNPGNTGAKLTDGIVTTISGGTLTMRGIVANGLTETSDYIQDFQITILAASIRIDSYPVSYMEVLFGAISETLTVDASIPVGGLTYQWYSNTVDSTTGGTAIPGATYSTLNIPGGIGTGLHYYFCKISASGGAASVFSTVSKVKVISKVIGVSISPKPTNMLQFNNTQLSAVVSPANATDKSVVWNSSNTSIASITDSGSITVNLPGTADITATTTDGGFVDKFTLTVLPFVSVTNITNVGTSTLSSVGLALTPTVVPSNAIDTKITWSILEDNGTGANIVNNTLTANNSTEDSIPVTIRATITNGLKPNIPFIKDFMIMIRPDYISVKSIMLITIETRAKTPLLLQTALDPINSTYKAITWSIVDDGGTNSNITGGVLTANNMGKVKVRATIANGTTKTTDYTQDFVISVIAEFIPVVDVTGAPTRIFTNNRTNSLDGQCVPSDATYRSVSWEIVDATTTGATFNTGVENILAISTGTFTLKAIVVSGLAPNVNFEKLFQVRVENFIPITDINNLPSVFRVDKQLALSGTLFPENASFKNITWSIASGGGTKAVISNGNILTAELTGTVRIRATITNGIGVVAEIGPGLVNDYIHEFDVVVLPKFIPITGITTSIPTTIIEKESITLSGNVVPTDSTNNDIVWSIFDAGTTGATLTGNTVSTTSAGDVKILATIINGTSDTTNYTQTFTVKVLPIVPVTNITGIPSTIAVGSPIPLTGTIAPSNATNQKIVWSIVDPGTTTVFLTPTSSTTTDVKAPLPGQFTLLATIVNGTNGTTDYVQNFVIRASNITAVTGITSTIPASATTGTSIPLTGTVAPDNATNKDIVWSIANLGSTNATITNGSINSTVSGTVTVRATIVKGINEATDYTQDFQIVYH